MNEATLLNDLVISTVKELNYWKKHQDSLKRRLLVECRFNLALLDMANWTGVNEEFKYYIFNHLQTDAAELAIEFSSNTIFTPIFKYFKPENDNEDSITGTLFSQLIARIKALKIIANIPKELSENNKALLTVRVNNLKILLQQLLSSLDLDKKI
jgi:hypothetical protein